MADTTSKPYANNSDIPNITAGDQVIATVDLGFTWVVRILTFIAAVIIFAMVVVIGEKAMPSIQQFGLGFIFSQEWDVPGDIFGALPYIYGTLVSSIIALILALPVAISVAIVTTEDFLPEWVRSPIAFIVELLAAIPSVAIGLWGIFVLIPFLQPIGTWLHGNFGWFPLFGTEPFGPGMLPAGAILAIMIVPTIASISRDVLLSTPQDLRSASMALGATRWETIIGVLFPAAVSGILGATLLGLGRALGETMAVTMVIGNSPQVSLSLLDLASTIPAVLANEFAEAQDGLHISSLMYLALLLFAVTLLVNVAAVFLVRFLGSKGQD
ncbi:MAG: phosphate ABC transporter permease subunit PstC [Leptolyngbyaceae bacterium]|nr:phosphate ABC transporter permease subunit PstC [Leptolyngbyaceae bacterium]